MDHVLGTMQKQLRRNHWIASLGRSSLHVGKQQRMMIFPFCSRGSLVGEPDWSELLVLSRKTRDLDGQI